MSKQTQNTICALEGEIARLKEELNALKDELDRELRIGTDYMNQLAASQAQLKETRANDLHSMRYLSEIRGMVGGDDYPDMIKRIAELVRSEK